MKISVTLKTKDVMSRNDSEGITSYREVRISYDVKKDETVEALMQRISDKRNALSSTDVLEIRKIEDVAY